MPVVLTAAVAAGCSGGGANGSAESPEMGVITTAAPSGAAEPESEADRQPVPGEDGECPYLSVDEASELTGEKLVSTQLDSSFDPPACFFSGEDGRLSLLVSFQDAGSPEKAAELVDGLVPPDSTERSDLDGGWTGGRTTAASGASLAVYRDAEVLTVQSTQTTSNAVQSIAERVAPRFG